MKFGCLLLVVCFVSWGNAQQFAHEYWHDGKVVLETGDTLVGSVKYDLNTDLIHFSVSGRLESFNARKLTYFEIFDKTVKRYRQFYSIPYNTSGEYKAPVFFELLAEGKITLLCRESVEYRTYSNSFYNYGTSSRLVLVNSFFMLGENGIIEPFVGKRADLIRLMGNKGPQVEKYIKANRLDITDKSEFTQIIIYYNTL